MEYKLVFGSMLATVEDEVNALMKLGWTVSGSLVNTQSQYIQPMTRDVYEVDVDMLTSTYAVAVEAE